jgi:hypothetical protein
MSNSYINQITLDFLLNKELMGKNVIRQSEKQINKEDFNFYRKRIFNLFKEIISNNTPSNLPPDVKYTYDTFIKSSINYFKVSDNNDILQEQYKDIEKAGSETIEETSLEQVNSLEADKLMMRSVKMDVSTLDKYVKRKTIKKEQIILPKTREVDIKNPELKNKGLKKNITNIYEKN